MRPQTIVVYGPGLDTVAILSQQPKALPFQRWLSKRSYELRTRGASFASPQAEQAYRQRITGQPMTPAVDGLSPNLTGLKMLVAEMEMAERRQHALALETKKLNGKVEILEKTVVPIEGRLSHLEDRFNENELREGSTTFTMMARRAGCYSEASKETKPHGRAVYLAALNDGFADKDTLRRRKVLIEKGPPVEAVE